MSEEEKTGLSVRGREERMIAGLWFERLVCGGRRPGENGGVENTLYLERQFCFCRSVCITDKGYRRNEKVGGISFFTYPLRFVSAACRSYWAFLPRCLSGPVPFGCPSTIQARIFFFKILFIFYREGKRGRKRGREILICGCLSRTPQWGPGL